MSEESCPTPVGIIVNPLAGTDIRRLVASAAPTTDMAKIGVIRRAVVGAIEGGARRLLFSDDRRSLAERALDRIERELDPAMASEVETEILEGPPHDHRSNTIRVARSMCERGVGAIVVLGGDGTHRDVVHGWRRAPIVPVSTGTNNVFPRQIEATLAGHAAGAVASGSIRLDAVAWSAKVIDVVVERGDGTTEHDLGLVDVALVESAFTGSRAVWHGDAIRTIVAAIAEPATVGLSSIVAASAACHRDEPVAVVVELDPHGSNTMRAPIAPGRYATLSTRSARRVPLGETVTLHGPGALSFDGERDIVLGIDDRASLTVSADGPRVIDVDAAMAAALTAQRTAATNISNKDD